MTQSDLKLISILNDWIFQSVWNEPYREQRRNIRPAVVSQQPCRARVQLQGTYLALPTPLNEDGIQTVPSFFVFYLPEQSISGMGYKFDINWTTLEEINNQAHIEIRAMSDNGICLVRSQCYLRRILIGKGLVVAISAKMLIHLLGDDCDLSAITISFFKDSDTARDLKIKSVLVSVANRKKITTPENLKYLLFNGQITPVANLKYQVGDYLEYVTDENIQLGYFVNYNDSAPYYYSSLTKDQKLILHMPKSLNPDQMVITHNTCDFIIYNKTQQKGRLLSRVFGDYSIKQLTHCDYGIDVTILNRYCDELRVTDNDEFGVMVLTRAFGNNNHLVRDSHYIYLLYTLTDEEIVKFLVGLGDPTLPFWKASSLENNVYIEFMFDTPETFDWDTVHKYIDGMGYFNIVALLSDRYVTFELDIIPDKPMEFMYKLPLILQYEANLRIEVLGYHNGIKMDEKWLSYTLNAGIVTVTINEEYPEQVSEGDYFSFETFAVPVYRSKMVENAKQGDIIDLIKDDYFVYESNDTDTVKMISGIQEYPTWRKADEDTFQVSETNTLYRYTVQTPNPAQKYLFFSKSRFKKVLDQNYALETPDFYGLGIELLLDDSDLPVLGEISALVFVNGKSLVRDIDYQIRTYQDTEGREMGKQILIQNVSYINQDINRIEVYISSDLEISNAYGFFSGEEISDQQVLPFWFDEISKLFLDGVLTDGVKSYLGELILHRVNARQGALYGVSTQVPEIVMEFLGDYGLMLDLERLNALREFFINRDPVPKTDFEIIPYSHHIYSIYTSVMIGDLIAYAEAHPDATQTDLRTELIRQQGDRIWIKNIDIAFQDYLSKRYVDIFPNYCRVILKNRFLYNVISDFVNNTLMGDTIQDKERVHD